VSIGDLHEKLSDDFWATDVEGFISLYIRRTPERVYCHFGFILNHYFITDRTGGSSNQFN